MLAIVQSVCPLGVETKHGPLQLLASRTAGQLLTIEYAHHSVTHTGTLTVIAKPAPAGPPAECC